MKTMTVSQPQKLLCVAIAALTASACVTNPDGTRRLDHRATGALLGAAAGCGLAVAATGKGDSCLVGAAVGAAAGLLIGWYFEAKKIAPAAEVNNEYQRKGYPVPKDKVAVVNESFRTDVKTMPAGKDEREVQLTSTTDLVGYGDKVPKMSQQYAIYDEKNQPVETKTESLTVVDGAGRYQTNSKFKLPASAKGKRYRVETTVLADNKPVKKNNYSIAFNDNGTLLVALR